MAVPTIYSNLIEYYEQVLEKDPVKAEKLSQAA